MKNKIYLIISIFFLTFSNILCAEEFKFEATEIEILNDGNLLKAKNGVGIKIDENIKISAENFTYNKTNSLLEVVGNVEIFDLINKIFIVGEKFDYNKKDDIITSKKNTNITIDNEYFVNTKNLTYFRNAKKISSNTLTKITDLNENIFKTENFLYDLKKGTFVGKSLTFIDNKNNNHFFNNAIVNLKEKKILGKDYSLIFNKETFGNSDNDPRLKGNTVYIDKNSTKITKGVFTTCKKKKDACPPWVISAEEVKHDKNKKIINYKNAWLKVYDKPVFYFPKFFHPDPTVKRQSGFLTPSLLSNTSLGSSIKLPYYFVVANNSDLTFKPRFFSEENILINTEFRQVNKNTEHIFDFGLNKKNMFADNSSSKTHFFSKSKLDLRLEAFDLSDLELKIQQTSNGTYLKTYDLDSPLIGSTSSLNSSLNFQAYSEDLSIESSVEVFEDLSIENKSDKYEYIFPSFSVTKIIGNNFNGDFYLETNGTKKQYDTNINETSLINNLIYESNKVVSEFGLLNNYDIILKNVNYESKNSKKLKDKKDSELLSAIMFTTTYPLRKNGDNFNSFFTPKISMRYSPNKTKNMTTDDRRIDINNIFSLNRIGVNNAIEGGKSITVGSSYKIQDKNNDELISLNLGSVFRDVRDADLPTRSTIGNKSSNIVGELNISPNKYLNINYDFSLDNSLDRSNYDLINAEFSVNNFVTSFEFLEENNELGSESYFGNKTSYIIDDRNLLKFNTRKNRKTDLTEFYNLVYQYQNDCLVAAIEYSKDYYTDKDLQPSEQIFFSLTIVPFSKTTSPNLK